VAELLDHLPVEMINAIQTHPLHQQGLRDIIGLIGDLRRCESESDLYDFQQELLARCWRSRSVALSAATR